MSFKLATARVRGQTLSCKSSRPRMDRLVGQANEVDIEVEGKVTRALLDTGSMISTISEKLAQSLDLDCQPLEDCSALRLQVVTSYSILGMLRQA